MVLGPKLDLKLYYDYTYYTWLRYRVDAPSGTMQAGLNMTAAVSRYAKFSFRYQYKLKQKNNTESVLVNDIHPFHASKIRLLWECNPIDILTLKTEVDYLLNHAKTLDYKHDGYSATFMFEKAKTMTDTFHGETEGYFLYSRHWNPSTLALCKALAAMEGTELAWTTGSGMAAITVALLHEVKAGDHILSSMTTYGGTFAFLNNYIKKFGVEVDFVNMQDLDAVKKAIKPNTKVLYTETMNNPLLRIANIPELSKIAHANGAKLLVDNTFTPMIFSPYQLGADVVIYSMTKYVNGMNDCVAGAICCYRCCY